MASIVCECCTTKGATVPVHVETVVQAVGLEDGQDVDKTQTWGTLSIDIDSNLQPPSPFLPATLVEPIGSQTESAGLHLSLGLQDMKLLRGTSLVKVLNHFGCELRPNSLNQSLTPEEAATLYRKSFEVKKLNYFISHCWKDERFAKVIALLMNNNLNVAMVGSTLVATALTILTRLKLLPVKKRGDGNLVDHFPWALSGGMLFFFLVFFTWHYVPTRRPPIYFLDKFCVHQADDKLKQLGVQSFAGFVAQSDRMLLLWSPEYFTRLWCTLELAALVKSKLLQDSQVSGSLKILPLKLAKVSFFTWVTVFLVYATNQFNRILGRPLPDLYILGAALWICTFVLTRALRQYAHDRKALHHQMETFSVQDSQCSDDRDRRWVERSMLRWFEDLERCNQHIRQVVRDQVEEGLGPERHIPTHLVMPVFLVNLFNEADYFAGGYHDHNFRIPLAALGFAAFALVLLPLSYRLCYCFAERRSWPMELLINFCIASFIVLFAFTVYVITHFVVANPETSVVVLAIPAVEIAVALWLQRRSVACRWFR